VAGGVRESGETGMEYAFFSSRLKGSVKKEGGKDNVIASGRVSWGKMS